MELDVNRIRPVQETVVLEKKQSTRETSRKQKPEKPLPDKTIATSFKQPEKTVKTIDIQKQLQEILHMTDTLNKRLKFTIDRRIDQVVVKVVDKETDKVIKEIPPESLMRLHIRMKEAIGLLIDEQI